MPLHLQTKTVSLKCVIQHSFTLCTSLIQSFCLHRQPVSIHSDNNPSCLSTSKNQLNFFLQSHQGKPHGKDRSIESVSSPRQDAAILYVGCSIGQFWESIPMSETPRRIKGKTVNGRSGDATLPQQVTTPRKSVDLMAAAKISPPTVSITPAQIPLSNGRSLPAVASALERIFSGTKTSKEWFRFFFSTDCRHRIPKPCENGYRQTADTTGCPGYQDISLYPPGHCQSEP